MEPAKALHQVLQLSTALRDHAQSTASVCAAGPTPDEGISILQAKSATLLRYNLNLLRLARLRVQGKPIAEVAERLVADWVALEKLRPLERRLRYQIDALLKAASPASASDTDRHRPDPSAVVVDSDDEDGASHGAYRPPRMAEVVYDGAGEQRREREARQAERAKMRKVRSEGVREMLAEVQGRPELVLGEELGAGRRSGEVRRLMKEDQERSQFEEENFTRLTVTRKDKKRRREIERALEAPGMDGGDEFAGLVAVADRVVKGRRGAAGRMVAESREAAGRREDEERVRALDEVTERMSSRSRSGRGGKKRRK